MLLDGVGVGEGAFATVTDPDAAHDFDQMPHEATTVWECVPADNEGKGIDHFPLLADPVAAAAGEPSTYSRTAPLAAGFVRVPETLPGVVVVPLLDAVTTAAATVTLGSQLPL